MRFWWKTIPSVFGMAIAVFSVTSAFAHHCEYGSKPGVIENGTYDSGKKRGLHSCAPQAKKLGYGFNRCIPVYDKDGKTFCQ